jgi:hypothetical protein
VTPARTKHPKKDVERALRFAELAGWTVRPTSTGHRWGDELPARQNRSLSRVDLVDS